MSAISAIANTSSAAATASADGVASRVPQKVLGQSDFLKLLAAQFKSQDPMKPMEDTAFIAQMAQFTALEQSSSMAKDMAALRTDQWQATANSYLGHRVTVDAGGGTTTVGDVAAIELTAGVPRIVVGGTSYPLSAVLRVEPGVLSVPLPAGSGGA